jgi:primosomal protein N' (replication factor Y)
MHTMRMDADTTSGKQAYDRLLEDFREGKADILLGTQMVTKGHDFPRVTLVGVMLADMGMYVNDFRASERTFSLLTQVIGRAGRSEQTGEAIIQTFSPDNDVIRLAQAQDYPAFYESEIKLREELCFPPFCDMVQLTLTSSDEKRLSQATKDFTDRVVSLAKEEYSDVPLELFGPMEAQVYKMSEQYRLRLVFKCRWNTRTRALFRRLLTDGTKDSRVSLAIDVNPLHA